MLGKLTGTKHQRFSFHLRWHGFLLHTNATSLIHHRYLNQKRKKKKKRKKERNSESVSEREIFTNRFRQNIRIVLSRWPNATRYRYNSKQRARACMNIWNESSDSGTTRFHKVISPMVSMGEKSNFLRTTLIRDLFRDIARKWKLKVWRITITDNVYIDNACIFYYPDNL